MTVSWIGASVQDDATELQTTVRPSRHDAWIRMPFGRRNLLSALESVLDRSLAIQCGRCDDLCDRIGAGASELAARVHPAFREIEV